MADMVIVDTTLYERKPGNIFLRGARVISAMVLNVVWDIRIMEQPNSIYIGKDVDDNQWAKSDSTYGITGDIRLMVDANSK